jgi:hypothetical protein
MVTLSALTLAHVLELSHRLAYDTRLWAHLASPDALYRYFGPCCPNGSRGTDPWGPVLLKQPRRGLDRRPARPVPGRQGDGAEHRRDRPTSHEVYEVPTGRLGEHRRGDGQRHPEQHDEPLGGTTPGMASDTSAAVASWWARTDLAGAPAGP